MATSEDRPGPPARATNWPLTTDSSRVVDARLYHQTAEDASQSPEHVGRKTAEPNRGAVGKRDDGVGHRFRSTWLTLLSPRLAHPRSMSLTAP